jgi:hypothetical protein
VSQQKSGPSGFFSPAEHKLKLSDGVIEEEEPQRRQGIGEIAGWDFRTILNPRLEVTFIGIAGEMIRGHLLIPFGQFDRHDTHCPKVAKVLAENVHNVQPPVGLKSYGQITADAVKLRL